MGEAEILRVSRLVPLPRKARRGKGFRERGITRRPIGATEQGARRIRPLVGGLTRRVHRGQDRGRVLEHDLVIRLRPRLIPEREGDLVIPCGGEIHPEVPQRGRAPPEVVDPRESDIDACRAVGFIDGTEGFPAERHTVARGGIQIVDDVGVVGPICDVRRRAPKVKPFSPTHFSLKRNNFW